jgi:hypothetical protein
MRLFVLLLFILWVGIACTTMDSDAPIDRFALATRHNVELHTPDTLGSLSVGNGEFAFTVDASGLQTFYSDYENGIPPGTQAQWAWHSIRNSEGYRREDVEKNFESCDGSTAPYPIQHKEGRAGAATAVLRENPHRLSLGMIGLILLKENGEEAKLSDLENLDQQLDLWTGKIESRYTVENTPVKVTLYAHQHEDRIGVRIESPLIDKQRLKIKFNFPYGATCHVCSGADFSQPEKHQSVLQTVSKNAATIERTLDTTSYFVHIDWNAGKLQSTDQPHHFELSPSGNGALEFTALFSREKNQSTSSFKSIEQNSRDQWKEFWSTGAVVDFSNCKDPRANELERRVVLSQYLTKIQCSGSLPPQETGLTMNSWYGKFHLEMHWWHGAHFALWDRAPLLEKSMAWYATVMPKAKATAERQGYRGARWQKMTDPYGDESPSSVGAFIIWQQPHPIYLSELLYRNNPTPETLDRYKEIVFETADFIASFLKLKGDQYHLCHPLIPAQEIFKATETDDPAYELQYWYFGLTTAQEWRKRLGMEADPAWNKIIKQLAPLAKSDGGLYLPTATSPAAYTDDFFRRDHPAVLGAYGLLPFNHRIDSAVMAATFNEIMNRWQWETTWGWDYPLVAMTAARLNKPEAAVDALLMETQKNTYLVNGHNYQDPRLRLYLPGNGGLLAAVAMMCAGWDGSTSATPGFPKNGNWDVKWEGLKKMP